MQQASFDLIADLAADPANGWSIGSFGAIGEFIRNADEPATIARAPGRIEIVTARGAMRIAPTTDLAGIAWDSLSADGESWGHALAFCCPRPDSGDRTIRALGDDASAIRPEDRADRLFDLGVGAGAVTMALRTGDVALIAALNAREGCALLAAPELMAEFLRAQPHRVLLSPAGRIEIFQPIPPPDGKSPVGPHTHLLVKLVPRDRTHSANVPIPEGLQSALSLHPRSPWRTILGERHAFKPEVDDAFAPLLARFGLPEDAAVTATLIHAIEAGTSPESGGWPETRRGRTKARIVLRRMAASGDRRVQPWRAIHDRAAPADDAIDIEEGDSA